MNKLFYGAKNKVLCLVLAAAVMTSAVACAKTKETTAPMAKTEEKEILVQVEHPQIGDIVVQTEFIGTVAPGEQVSVFPKVAGTVLHTHAAVGQTVKKGDLLFEIDPQDIATQVNVAKAALNTAQASVDQALGSAYEARIIQSESAVQNAGNAYQNTRDQMKNYGEGLDAQLAGMDLQIDALQGQLQQAQAVYDSAVGEALKAVAKAEMEKVASALNKARTARSGIIEGYDANLEGLKSAKRSAGSAYDAAQQANELTQNAARDDATRLAAAQLGQAVASYEATAKQLTYTKIYAPIDGVIEEKNVEENAMSSQQSSAYTVSNKEKMVVTFYVSAQAVRAMEAGATIQLESGNDTYTGSLIEIGTMVNPSTGLFQVKAEIDGSTGLLSGMSVKVKAETAKASGSVLIAQNAVYYEDSKPYAYCMQDGKAVKVPLTLGISNVEQVEVLSGLSPEDNLVVTWNPNLADGARLKTDASTAPQTQEPAAAPTEG